ncbi:dioxygenase family protein [Runella aurantiaca]|uniref:Catechol 1,2-dioxygenase n=1 Tax=Runella aurantiaca TaxID=2282308 RepID=A0A369IJH0_9BACT|nr:catechol 1,2-dioxygenase [Runella aurantiaca]RDB07414.1 catechol 1,2-dioxygenase [Runella aurantiaca]
MKRRTFLKTSALSAIAVSTTGFVRLEDDRYVGDCETTSDILGPFYRPDSPIRSSLVIKGEKGAPIELFGKIKHDDCITPYKNAKIELWHCNGNGVYDNESADFKYRGTLYSDNGGNYSFKTILPVPYGEGNNYRPAHFHMMISAEGYQPLVTQLYFTGDPWLEKDSSSASPTAKRRILEVQNLKDGSKKVSFDVSMAKKLAAEPAALDRLIGIYVNEKDANKKTELIKKDKQLWIKGDKANGMPFGMNLEYITNNTFTISGVPPKYQLSFAFEVMPSGAIKMMENFTNEKGEMETTVSVKGK